MWLCMIEEVFRDDYAEVDAIEVYVRLKSTLYLLCRPSCRN